MNRMSTVPTLLVFRLNRMTRNAGRNEVDLDTPPNGCSIIVVSGGMDDLQGRAERFNTNLLRGGVNFDDTPFLHAAPQQVAVRIAWSLLGPTGRLYPVFRTFRSSVESWGWMQAD
jgi:hypothetical protein